MTRICYGKIRTGQFMRSFVLRGLSERNRVALRSGFVRYLFCFWCEELRSYDLSRLSPKPPFGAFRNNFAV